MASYKDTAEMEYTGKDNLSKVVKSITRELDQQRSQAERTTSKLEQYQVELDLHAKTLKRTEEAMNKYNKELDEESRKLTESKIAQKEYARENALLVKQFNQVSKSLNNLNKDEQENAALIDRLTREHKQYYNAIKKSDKALAQQKSITEELTRATTQADTALKRATRQNNQAAKQYDEVSAKVDKYNIKLAGENEAITKLSSKLNKATNAQNKEAKATTKTIDVTGKYTSILRDNIQKVADVTAKTAKYIQVAEKYNTKVQKVVQKTGLSTKAFKTLDPAIDSVVNSTIKLTSKIPPLNKVIDKLNLEEKELKVSNKTLSQTMKDVSAKASTMAQRLTKTKVEETKLEKATKKANTALKKETEEMKKLTAQTKKADRGLGKMTTSTQKFSSGLFAVTGAFAGPIAAVYAFMSAGNSLADTLLQNDNVNRQYAASLGDSTAEMDALYDSTLKYLGISYQEMQTTSARFEQQAESMGMAKDAAIELSEAATEVSAVLSVTNLKNLDMADTSERLISGLRGEAEAAEALGLQLNATQMQEYLEKLQAQGVAIEGNFGSLDQTTQMQIRLGAAIEQTAGITDSSIGPITDMASAQDAVNIIMEDATEHMTDAQKASIRWKIAVNDIKQALRGLGVPLLGVLTIILEIAGDIIEFVAPAFDILTQIVYAAATAVQWLWEQGFQILAGVIQDVIDLIKPLVDAFLDWVKSSGIIGKVTAILSAIFALLGWVIDKVTGFIKKIIDAIIDTGKESEVAGILVGFLTLAVTIAGTIIKKVTGIIKDIIQRIKDWNEETGFLTQVWEIFIDVITVVWELIKIGIQLIEAIWEVFGPLIEVVIELNVLFWETFGPAIAWLLELFADLIQIMLEDLIPVLQSFNDYLSETVLPTLQKFGDWIDEWVIQPLDHVIEKIKETMDWFGNLFHKSEDTMKEVNQDIDEANAAAAEDQAAVYAVNVVNTTGRAYGNISQPMPYGVGGATYNSSRTNLVFQVNGTYRKSLASLHRDAQVMARQKGVPLR